MMQAVLLAPRSNGSSLLVLWSVCTLSWLLAGCIYDTKDRCGPNQVYAGADTCRCKKGYELAGDMVTCVEAGEAPAPDACESDDDCGGPADHCASPGEEGYCTVSGCDSSADCDEGWYCAREDEPSYCHAPPTGLGESCGSDADCEGLDATLCDSVQTNTCQIVDCTVETPCPNGYVCCDLTPTGFFEGTLCMQGDACLAGELIE